MLIYLQARQVTVTDKGKGQEVQKVKERKKNHKNKVQGYMLHPYKPLHACSNAA